MDFDRALIIDEPWISKILSGEKTLEMRSRHTKIRGRIGLIRKGSGLIVGDVWLDDSIKIKPAMLILFKKVVIVLIMKKILNLRNTMSLGSWRE